MYKIKQFVISNYAEILSVFSLFLIFLFLVIKLWNHFGIILIDSGREAYFPELILKGKILYRDIFNIFGPLSYQINAIFYKIFGISLNTLRLAGALNAFITIFLLYFITRLFTSRDISWIISVFIIITCAVRGFNYVFTYSYAATYAFSSFLFSVLFLMLYFKTLKQYFIPLSWFFIGVSIASKYDYIPFVIFLALFTIFMMYNKKIDKKNILYIIVSFLVIPVIGFSILFLQGLTFKELLNQSHFIEKYAFSKTLNYFYLTKVGTHPYINNFIFSLKSFLKFFPGFLFVLTMIYLPLKYNKPFLYIMFTGILFYYFFSRHLHSYFDTFSWLPIFTLFLFGFMLIKLIKNKNYKQDGAYVILIAIALIASVKSFFFLNMTLYGSFTFPLLFIANSIFIVEYLPDEFKFINPKPLKQAFFIVFFTIIVVCYRNLNVYYGYMHILKYERGNIGDSKSIAVATSQTIDYIKKILKPQDSIWVIPDGLMINFLTDNPSNGIYYNLTPPYIETFGEDKIIADTEKNPPDYVIINDRDSSEYGYKYFCKDYGFMICNYVKSNYTPVKKFGRDFKMILYKNRSITK